MFGKTSVNNVLLLGSLVTSLGGCVAAVDDVEPGAGEPGEVKQVEQALGGWTRLHLAPAGDTPLDLSIGTAIFKRTVSGCDQVSVVKTSDGQPLPNVSLPGCASITAASASARVVGDSRQRAIYRFRDFEGVWQTIATNTGSNIRKIAYDSLRVYWEDDLGIHRVDDDGRLRHTITTDTQLALVATEGGFSNPTVYVEKLEGSSYKLSAIDNVFGTLTPIASKGMPWGIKLKSSPGETGFTFDANHFYFVENASVFGSVPNRLRRLEKDGSPFADVRSSTEVFYFSPLTNGSTLWWREEPISGGTARIRRRNLLNGNMVSADFPMLKLHQMVLASDGIYAVGLVQNSPALYALERTSR